MLRFGNSTAHPRTRTDRRDLDESLGSRLLCPPRLARQVHQLFEFLDEHADELRPLRRHPIHVEVPAALIERIGHRRLGRVRANRRLLLRGARACHRSHKRISSGAIYSHSRVV